MIELTVLNRNLLRCLIRRPFSSSTESSKLGNDVSPFIYNRNPRNLERLRIAPKHAGYTLDTLPTNYWNRIIIQQSNKHIDAHIEHFQGNVVVSVSTKEWAVKQFLRNTSDKNAAAAIGKILGQRCLECGLLEVQSHYNPEKISEKVASILKGVEKAGISLTEPERYRPHRHWSREEQENPTQVYEDKI